MTQFDDTSIIAKAAHLAHASGRTLEEAEVLFRRTFLVVALKDCRGNQCKTARVLGIHRNTLSRHIALLGIEVEHVAKKKPYAVKADARRREQLIP